MPIDFDTYEGADLGPGIHTAKIIEAKIDMEAKFGPQIVLVFRIEDPETMDHVDVKAWAKPQISTKYPLFAGLRSLLEQDDVKKGSFDEKELIGMDCKAICVKKGDFLNVTNVSPLDSEGK